MMKLTNAQAENAFDRILSEYRVVAPKRKHGAGRFSDMDVIAYDDIGSLQEIVFSEKTETSAKSVLFPTREAMFNCGAGRIEEVTPDNRPTVVFLRACDVNALKVTDEVFLRNGGCMDSYYSRRRKNLKIFLLECPRQFETCFCVSMGSGRTKDYSVFLRKDADGYAVQVKDDDFPAFFTEGEEADVWPGFPTEDRASLEISEEIDNSIFADEMWKEYTRRCIACGRCNTSCPTCTCFSVQDIPNGDGRDGNKRKRIWSSCQVKNFARLAGDHDFRVPNGDRMRYKVLHKIRDFKRRSGFHMCTGCGRCDDVCPEYISMFRCIERINKIAASGGTD
ncbi:MAG: anaerobic sulfite reductase subunit AsrA [Phycisphaerae bacterium]|nr:anaerobic sulfite reductase subunit AsrA [Phycisphaerae bacterium]